MAKAAKLFIWGSRKKARDNISHHTLQYTQDGTPQRGKRTFSVLRALVKNGIDNFNSWKRAVDMYCMYMYEERSSECRY